MEKEEAFQGTYELFEGKEKVYDGFYKEILTLKQMLQRLPVVLTQVKVDNTSDNLLIKIRQIIYSLNRPKKL